MEKHAISVCLKGAKYKEPGKEIEVIHRTLRSEAIGNFNPIFCTYQGKKHFGNKIFCHPVYYEKLNILIKGK
jgi:hypothetical protein